MRKIQIAVLLLCTLFAQYAFAGQVTLAWDASTGPDITGYKIYYGTTTGVYPNVVDVGKVLTFIVINIPVTGTNPSGTKYFFVVTAYNPGAESGYSNEVNTFVPWAKPTVPGNLKTTATSAQLKGKIKKITFKGAKKAAVTLPLPSAEPQGALTVTGTFN